MMNVCFFRIPSNTFLACSVAEDFYREMMTWLNNAHKSAQIKMTKQQILFSDFTMLLPQSRSPVVAKMNNNSLV